MLTTLKEKFQSIKEHLANSFLRKKIIFWLGLGVILVILIFVLIGGSKNTSSTSVVSSDKSTKATATATIEKTFEFHAVNAKKELIPVSFTITSMERKDEIRVKDKARKLTGSKDYLLIRIEIQNDTTDRVAIATTDHIRLVGENDKLFAPDYHNGNVVIDPLSVRRDIVAFVVDEGVNKFTFQVGELTGDKQKIEVIF